MKRKGEAIDSSPIIFEKIHPSIHPSFVSIHTYTCFYRILGGTYMRWGDEGYSSATAICQEDNASFYQLLGLESQVCKDVGGVFWVYERARR